MHGRPRKRLKKEDKIMRTRTKLLLAVGTTTAITAVTFVVVRSAMIGIGVFAVAMVLSLLLMNPLFNPLVGEPHVGRYIVDGNPDQAIGGSGSFPPTSLSDLQRPPKHLPANAPKLPPILLDAGGRKITSLAAWQSQRAAVRRWWLDFLKPPIAGGRRPPPLAVVAEDHPEGVIRQLVRYEVEPGLSTEAYLLKPATCGRPAPGVLVFHSTVDPSIRQPAGVEGEYSKAFGLKLARRGYVAFCPRNFLWPETARFAPQQEVQRFQQRHPRAKGMAKMLFDATVALDILAGLPEVDHRRLGAVGHSLGAKEVLYLAALDERIQVAVSSEGGIGTKFSNWDAPWYLGNAIREGSFTHEHHELLALAAPRPFLLVGGDSADGVMSWPFIEAALPVYRLYGDPPRLGLFNHKQGHCVPPAAERQIYNWLDTYLYHCTKTRAIRDAAWPSQSTGQRPVL